MERGSRGREQPDAVATAGCVQIEQTEDDDFGEYVLLFFLV